MSNSPQNHQNQLFPPGNTPGLQSLNPDRIARRVADGVKSLLVILFWLVVLVTGLAASAVVVSAVLVACAHARRALGI